MVVDLAEIERLEKQLEQARAQLWKDDAERYRVLWKGITEEERDRFLDSLTDKRERILFGLEAPEEEKKRGERPGKSGGDLECEVCGKSGLTKRGLGLHMVRKHKEEARKQLEVPM
jgi:hypothetical protein